MSDTKTICKRLIKDYCENSSFAGIHFIADDSKHWIERLLWVVLVILSWYGAVLLIISAWEAFVLSPISFGVDTVYIDWDTRMPTVAVCEIRNSVNSPMYQQKIYDVSDALWTVNHLADLEDALREIVYYRGASRILINNCYLKAKPDPNCPMSNYSYYASLVRSDCDNFLKNCSYNNEEFPCCEYFLPIETDMGPCFIINSVQTKKQHPYPMIVNITNRQGSLKFVTQLSSMVYTIGDDEVPTITTSHMSSLKIQPGYSYRRILSVRNIQNDPLISETTPEQRACRFHDENEGGLYPQYSYSGCTVLCRKRAQLEMCKCNDHFMLNTTENERCNISGMVCLNSLTQVLTILKPFWAQRDGLTCDCLPSCDEEEITVISDFSVSLGKANKENKRRSPVEIVLADAPTEKFKRNVVRSRLDLVVSVGGTTGLFVGASILSFVELFFFFTVRLFNNLCMNRQMKRNSNIVIVTPKYKSNIKDPKNVKIDMFDKDALRGPYPTSGVINTYSKVVRPYRH